MSVCVYQQIFRRVTEWTSVRIMLVNLQSEGTQFGFLDCQSMKVNFEWYEGRTESHEQQFFVK